MQDGQFNEAHLGEIEKVLLYISEARERAARARATLEKTGADAHLLLALTESEVTLRQEHRRLMQSTFHAAPAQEQMAV